MTNNNKTAPNPKTKEWPAQASKFSYWISGKLVYPKILTNPPPHGDMPYSVVRYYKEARQIAEDSPRVAAALLRLAAKKLCEELGETEQNLNRAIGNSEHIIKAAEESRERIRLKFN